MAKAAKAKLSKESAHRPNTTRKPGNPGGIARPETKASRMLTHLTRVEGATITQLMKETGWQHHSMRGYLSGTLGKRFGHKVISAKSDGVRCYRIISKGCPP